MATYVILMNLTDQGINAIKEAPERLEQSIKVWEQMGGKVTGFYTLMGEFDYLAIAEAPNDESVAAFVLALGAQGNVRTTMHRAFTNEEIANIIKKRA